MAITFIPEVWAANLLEELRTRLVYGDAVNHDYEGDIAQMGDTVHIRSVGNPTIGTYVSGTTVIVPEALTDTERLLLIDQAKYFAFKIDDVETAQSAGGDMEMGMRNAAFALANVADRFIAGLHTGAATANKIGTVAVTTAQLAYDQVAKLALLLDEANVSEQGRFCIVPPWYYSLLLKNDLFLRADAAGTDAGVRNGMVGSILGFDVRKSNNAPLVTGDDYAVIAGTTEAISFAQQINKVESYRPESAFADAVKGLHLYGAKVVRPEALATVVASKT